MTLRTLALAIALAPAALTGCDESASDMAVEMEAGVDERAPFARKTLYVDPTNHYSVQAAVYRAAEPWNADLMDAMAAQPTALWVGDWTNDVAGTVDDAISVAGTQLRSFVIYNIPYRDCGNWSAGGAQDVADYADFIQDFADGINGRRAIVILEPDGLPLMDCLTVEQVDERLALMSDAVDTLTDAGASVYIDAGDSAWLSATTIADRLEKANVARAAGFSLNVSHTEYTTDEVAYAEELRAIVGSDEHYVVDTGRNGNGPDATHEWCNPLGRATGSVPTLKTGKTPGLDAKLWIKAPGESDGSCNGGPIAGAFWAEYAVELGSLGGM